MIEAIFSKTPVITSNLSCLPEAGGENSVYINPYDVEDLKAKILFLWNNESERNRRAEKSFEFVQKFNDEKIALSKRFIKIIDDFSSFTPSVSIHQLAPFVKKKEY